MPLTLLPLLLPEIGIFTAAEVEKTKLKLCGLMYSAELVPSRDGDFLKLMHTYQVPE